MPELTQFFMAMGIALGVGVIATFALYKPMWRVLTLVCGTEVAAGFWTGFAALFMVLLPLLSVAATTWLGGSDVTPTETLARTFSVGIAGLLTAVAAVGRQLMKYVEPKAAAEDKYSTWSWSKVEATADGEQRSGPGQ